MLLHIILLAALVAAAARAQSSAFSCPDDKVLCPDDKPGDEHYTRKCLNDWERNRTYVLATDAPIATKLALSSEAKDALRDLVAHFDKVGARVRELNSNPSPSSVVQVTRVGNVDNEKANLCSVERSLSRYGWGLVKKQVVTEIADPLPERTVNAMRTYFDVLNKSATAINSNLRQNWPNAQTYALFGYKDAVESCKLRHVVAWRVNGTWGINTGITNDRPSRSLPERQRSYIVEILRSGKNGMPEPVPITMPKWPTQDKWIRSATTLLAVWGGIPEASLFRSTLERREVPAVAAALQMGRDARDQVEASTTISGIAILVFPLAFAALPVAAIADVGPLSGLMYTIATDFLSVLPLAIKGFELIHFARTSHVASRTWVYAGAVDDELACAETWYADCMANQRVVIIGRAFVITAAFATVFGVVLELIFYLRLQTSKKATTKNMSYNLEVGAPQLWQYSTCKECECGGSGDSEESGSGWFCTMWGRCKDRF